MKKITKITSIALFFVFFVIAICSLIWQFGENMFLACSLSSFFLAWSAIFDLQAQCNKQVMEIMLDHPQGKRLIENFSNKKMVSHEKNSRLFYYIMLLFSVVSFFSIAFCKITIDDKLSDFLTILCVGANFFTIWYGLYAKDKITKFKETLGEIENIIDKIENKNEEHR